VPKLLSLRFFQWLSTPMGKSLLDEEVEILACILKTAKPVDTALVVGEQPYQKLLDFLPCTVGKIISENVEQLNVKHVINARYTALPVAHQSVDMVILPHTLDFTQKPHQVLQEANHCLKPEGILVILGFNPWGIWGCRRFFSLRREAPWCGRFRPMLRVLDWLSVLSFKRESCHYGVYHWPVAGKVLQWVALLGKWIARLVPFSGGVYVVVARKRVFGMTPLRHKRWIKLKKPLKNGVPNPAVRDMLSRKREKHAKDC
jgi:SAM-dependent methyltransferase